MDKFLKMVVYVYLILKFIQKSAAKKYELAVGSDTL